MCTPKLYIGGRTLTVPYGSAGKFVYELSTLYRAYAEGSTMECIALKTITVMSVLLQKAHFKSKPKDHSSCLERCLQSWSEGDLNNLLLEGRILQNHLPKPNASKNGSTSLALTFSLQLLTQNGNSGVLPVNDPVHQSDSESQTVLDILKSKHPQAQPASPDTILWNSSKAPQIHPVIFDQINASSIRSADLRTKGAAGPSGIDAYC